jgi:DtxR family Mn-dependent transcriptional regulator
MAVTPSVIEDYVKVIYTHTEWQSQPISTTGLATRLALAASTVTEMIKKLVRIGFVVHEPYGAIELTPEGLRLALQMVRRHRLIETWLVQHHGYRWHEVHDEAEVLEHGMSDRLLDSIDDQLGKPTRDPHGDAIPGRDGTVNRPDAELLESLAEGVQGAVARISDDDPQLLSHLEAEGVYLDALVTRTGTGATIGQSTITDEALRAIWVVVSGGTPSPTFP